MKLDPVITLVLGSRLPFKEIPQLLYHPLVNTNLDSYQSSGFNILDDLTRYTGLSVTAVLENDSPCPEKQRWQTAQAPRDNGKLYRKIQGEKDEDTRQLATHNINNIVQR
ncbi:hypothetical protein L4D20_18730 [Vibrio kyushuensis]|uniref:hypothetical protein n=1 Tax=Vibrio kyushuensis TaxID=2910249 RepID=UPI003D0AB178